jgi:hypothetical protein
MKRVKTTAQMVAALKDFAKEVNIELGAIIKAGAFDLHNQMMILTPKDTGWASQHWSISLTTNDAESPTIDILTSFKIGDTIHIFSNVPYIKKLDEGWSTQRPSGFTYLGISYIANKFNEKLNNIKNRRYE